MLSFFLFQFSCFLVQVVSFDSIVERGLQKDFFHLCKFDKLKIEKKNDAVFVRKQT